MRNLKIAFATVFLINLTGGNLPAQQRVDPPADTARWTIGATQFRVGSMQLGLDELNARLAANNRPVFSNTVPTLGVSTYARRGRLIGGASIDGSLSHKTVDASWTTKLSVSSATLDGGVIVVDESRVMITGVVSLGLERTSLHFEQRGDFTYSDGLGDPARGLDLMSHVGIAQFGVRAEWRFETRRIGMFSVVGESGTTQPFGGAATFAGENHVRETPAATGGRYVRVAFAKPIAHGRRALDTVSGALLSMLFR